MSLRSKLIRLASTMPKGADRKQVLALLKSAKKWQGYTVADPDIFWDPAYYVREKSSQRPNQMDAKRTGISPFGRGSKEVLFPAAFGGEAASAKFLAEAQAANPGKRLEVVWESGTYVDWD